MDLSNNEITLTATGDVHDRLQVLVEMGGGKDVEDLTRRAFALYDALVVASYEGKEVLLRDPKHGNEEKIRILLSDDTVPTPDLSK